MLYEQKMKYNEINFFTLIVSLVQSLYPLFLVQKTLTYENPQYIPHKNLKNQFL